MTVNNIYKKLGQVLFDTIDDEFWTEATLNIIRLKGSARFNGFFINSKNEKVNI